MKLFTKDIDDKLFEQYSKGADLEKQVAVAKIFNPYGRGTWYLLNSDPNDPDYLWAIVDLYEVESGSASRSELESMKVPPFNQHLERDLGFKPVNALELFNRLRENKQRNRMMAKGGGVDVKSKGKYVEVVLNEGYGKVINELYNEWNNINDEKQYADWVKKVKETKFGTYGTITFEEVLNRFNFDDAPINSFHLKTFKKELENALNKNKFFEDGGGVGIDFKNFTIDEFKSFVKSINAGGDIEVSVSEGNNVNTIGTYDNKIPQEKLKKIKNLSFSIGDAGRNISVSTGEENIYADILVYDNNWDKGYKEYTISLFSKEDREGLKSIVNSIIVKFAKGGGVYRLKDFDFNEEGNLQAIINDKKYEIIYRDDVSQMYDLFENGKVIKSSRIFRELTKFAEGGMLGEMEEIDLNKLDMPIIRTQFEEEVFEYENGGAIFKRTMKTPNGTIVGKVEYNDFWKTYQVVIDGTVYEEFKTKEEAINNLKNAGFDKMALGGGLNGNFYIILNDGSKKWYSESNITKIPNIYFASGFQDKEDEGVAFVHYDNALRPVYKDNGERADKIVQYAGMEGRDIKAKGGEVGDNKFTYMMLSRLQSDNDYYLRNPYEKNLWAGNVDAQIKEMKRLWNSLPKNEKPEWLSMEDILEYESKMKGKFEEGGNLNFDEIDIPVIRTQFEEEDYEYEKGGEITNEERKESLKNYPKLKF